MKLSRHIYLSSLLAIALYPTFKWKIIFVMAGGVLVDSDHYLWYVFRKRDLSVRRCYEYYMSSVMSRDFRKHYGILLVFHSIEFLLLVAVLSYFFQTVFAFACGLLLHYLLDGIFLLTVPKGFIADYSIVKWLIRNLN